MFSEMFFGEFFLEFQELFGEVFQPVSEEEGLGRGKIKSRKLSCSIRNFFEYFIAGRLTDFCLERDILTNWKVKKVRKY